MEFEGAAVIFLFLKFIYSEKTTKFCKIFTLLLSYVVPVKSKVKISQNYVAFSEYMNFTNNVDKVHIFWKVHKNMMKSPGIFYTLLLVTSKKVWRVLHIFVVFSEYIDFMTLAEFGMKK